MKYLYILSIIIFIFTNENVSFSQENTKYRKPSIKWSQEGDMLLVSNNSKSCAYNWANLDLIQYSEFDSGIESVILDANRNLLLAHADGTIQIQNIESQSSSSLFEHSFEFPISSIQLNIDGSLLLLLGLEERRAELWDMATQSIYADIDNGLSCKSCSNSFKQSDFSPDGKYLALESRDYSTDAGRTLIWLWDIDANQEARVLSYPDEVSFVDYESIASIDFNQDSGLIVASTDRGLLLFWNVETGEYLGSYGLTDFGYTTTRFNPTADLLAIGGRELVFAEVKLSEGTLEIDALTLYEDYSGILDLAFNPTGKYLATVDYNGVATIFSTEIRQKVLVLDDCQTAN